MDFLLIGESRFAQRRVQPAAAALAFDSTTIASRRRGTGRRGLHRPGLAYVSLANGDHYEAVIGALRQGNHVVVDKPAFPTLAEAESAVALARESSLVLAEANCYAHHPMFAFARSLDATFTRAVAVFTPPVPATDFRHDRARGGGAFLDTGPYFASLGRVLWDAEPDRVEVIVGDRAPDGLELSYSVLAGYPGGRTVVGQFGFTTTYRNSLQLLGPDTDVDFERPFSAPPGLSPAVRVGEHTHRIPPADSMVLFLTDVLAAAGSGSRRFDDPLLSDARTRERLSRCA